MVPNRLSTAFAVGMVAVLAGPAVAQNLAVEPRAMVFGGDREFPPYEYLDENGQPQGFNIQLIRALAREAGPAVEIRLGPRDERMAEFDAGETDVMFLSYSDERAARYQLLDQTWTLAQVILMKPGLPRYPRGLDDLWGVRVAVDNGSINHLLLSRLPEARRPTLIVVATRGEAIEAFKRGEVDGVAGNHLTLRFMMGALADGATEVPLLARPYQLAVLPGRDLAVAPLRIALDRLKATGEFDRIVEQHLSSPVRRTWIERYAAVVGIASGLVVLLFVSVTAWNRSLAQAGARPNAGGGAHRAAVSRPGRQRQRHDLSHRPVRAVHVRQSVATRILGYAETELLAMKYFELMRPDWVPSAMTFYETSAKAREASYLEFPVRRKDGTELWVGQHVRVIITGGQIEGFQGMARDITDRVNAQAELRAERDFVSAILDMAPVLVTVMDQDSRLVRFNRACELLTGLAAEQVLGKLFWELPFLVAEDRVGMPERIAGYADISSATTIDRIWVDHTGARRLIEWAVAPLRNREGHSVFVIAIGTDVTATRALDRLKS